MASTSPPTSNEKSLLYILLGLVAIPALVLLYYFLNFLGVNFFLGLDLSAYGHLAAVSWPGYVVMGLGLGAAAGTVAAQQRFRLHWGLSTGAAALAFGLSLLAILTQPSSANSPKPATEAQLYKSAKGRVACAACTSIAPIDAYPAQNGNDYEASNLLRRDSTRAWISATPLVEADPLLPTIKLRLIIAPLAGHQLAGLRLRNGYCKNAGVYQSFGRVAMCQTQLPNSLPQTWQLPDAQYQELFLPLATASRDSTSLTFTITSSYPGTNHQEVALAWLVPVFEPAAP